MMLWLLCEGKYPVYINNMNISQERPSEKQQSCSPHEKRWQFFGIISPESRIKKNE